MPFLIKTGILLTLGFLVWCLVVGTPQTAIQFMHVLGAGVALLFSGIAYLVNHIR